MPRQLPRCRECGANPRVRQAPLAGEFMVYREPSLRLGILARSFSGAMIYCDWDLAQDLCAFTRTFSALGPLSGSSLSPTDFGYTSFTPFPGWDIDVRSRPGDREFFKTAAVWADQSFTRTSVSSDLIGSAGGRYSRSCSGRDCLVWFNHNWFSFAYSGCHRCCMPDGTTYYGSGDVWPADFCTASPWRFIEVGRNFSTDERWLHSMWGRDTYLVAAATADVLYEGFDWLGALAAPTCTCTRI
eukprot:tig00021621_g22973.t1